MTSRRLWLAVLGLGLAAAPLPAQPRRLAEPGANLEEIVSRISRIRLAELAERLDLSDEQFLRVARIDRAFLARRLEAFQARRRTAEQLKLVLGGGRSDDGRINALLAELEAQEDLLYQVRKEELAELRKHLAPAQVAHYLIFDREFDRMISHRLENAQELGPAQRGPKP